MSATKISSQQTANYLTLTSILKISWPKEGTLHRNNFDSVWAQIEVYSLSISQTIFTDIALSSIRTLPSLEWTNGPANIISLSKSWTYETSKAGHPMLPVFFIRSAIGVWKQLRNADPLRWKTPDKILERSP